VLLRNQAAALRDDRPSASDRERLSRPKPCCGRDPLLFIQLILVALACRRVLPVALRSCFLLFLIQRSVFTNLKHCCSPACFSLHAAHFAETCFVLCKYRAKPSSIPFFVFALFQCVATLCSFDSVTSRPGLRTRSDADGLSSRSAAARLRKSITNIMTGSLCK